MAAGAVSLKKSHDIVILSFCNIVKGQAKWVKIFMKYNTLIRASSRFPMHPEKITADIGELF